MWSEIDAYDAIHKMLETMSRLKGRRILIFVGSGFDTLSSHTIDDIEDRLEQTNVVFYAVGAGSILRGYYDRYLSTMQRMDLMQAEAFLRGMADKSGGWAAFPRFETAVPDVVLGVMQSIEFQHKIV